MPPWHLIRSLLQRAYHPARRFRYFVESARAGRLESRSLARCDNRYATIRLLPIEERDLPAQLQHLLQIDRLIKRNRFGAEGSSSIKHRCVLEASDLR